MRNERRTEETTEGRTPRVRVVWFALAAALLTFAAYVPSIGHPFVVWDDGANFVENPHYRGLGPDQLAWMFTTFHLGPYQPLSWMTLGLDYELWGMDARGYHFTNVLIHAAAAGLLCLLSARLAAIGRRSDSSGTCLFGLAVALLWSLHPLRVEAVSWVTERREVLSGALVFATLLVAARGGRWWLVALLALLALLAKGTAVTLAPLLVLVDLFRSGGSTAGGLGRVALASVRRHALVVVLAGVFAYLAIVGQRHAEAMIPVGALSPFERLRIFANSTGFYVAKTLWPVDVAPMYDPPPDRSVLNGPAALAAVGLAAVLVLFWRSRARLGALWLLPVAYVVSLLPIGGLVQVGSQLVADRYAYQPGAWITLALVSCAGPLLARAWPLAARAAVLVAACGLLCWRTVPQQRIWSESEALWRHQLSIHPDSPIAHLHMGLLQVEGKLAGSTPAEAEAHFRSAVARSPSYGDAWCALGDLLARQGRAGEALSAYEAALRGQPRHRAALRGWADCLWRAGRTEEALAALRRLCDAAPGEFQPRLLLGRALAAAGGTREALAEYERAIRLDPAAIRPVTELAWLLSTHPDPAARDGSRALTLAEGAARAFGSGEHYVVQARTAALAELGRFDEAVAILTEVRHTLPAAEAGELDGLIAQFRSGAPLRVPPAYP